MIQLEKPLVFFDLETTGINVSHDRIVEIYAKKFMPDGDEVEYYRTVNPGIPIPAGASQVHGFTNESVASSPSFSEIKDELKEFFHHVDLGGYNILRFDVPILVEELLRVGVEGLFDQSNIVDSMIIFHKMVPRNLAGALRYYKNEELNNAHSAQADVQATIDIFEQQVKVHADLPASTIGIQNFMLNNQEFVDFAGYFKKDMSGDIVFNFGKHKGKKVSNETGYLEWMLQSDFPAQTKRKIKHLLNR